jgi:hypothetical protein
VGAFFAVASLVFPIDYLTKQDAYYTGLILVGIAGFIFTVLIAWTAYKWQKDSL